MLIPLLALLFLPPGVHAQFQDAPPEIQAILLKARMGQTPTPQEQQQLSA
jgi:hypothetical protein